MNDPINELRNADPSRSLRPLDEPWRLREKILMSNQIHDTGTIAAAHESERPNRVVQTVGALCLVAAVWGLVAVSGGSALPTIALNAGGRSAAAGAPNAETTADGKMAIWAPTNFEFVLDEGVNIPAGKENVYRWVGPTKSEVQALADKLGVEGALSVTPADQGGGWHIGDINTYTEGSVYFAAMGSGSFSYSSTMGVKSGVACAPVGAPDAPDASTSSGTSADGNGTSGPNDTLCDGMPEPVKNLPTKSEAQEKLTKFFGDLTDVNIYEDAYSVYASGATRVGDTALGDAAKQWVSMSFGENGAITSAYGMLGRLEKVGTYPTISASDAVERLSQMQFFAGGGGIANGSARDSGIASGGSGSATAGDSATSETTPSTVLVDPIPVPSGKGSAPKVTIETLPAQPMPTVPFSPSTTVPVQTVTVSLVKVVVVYQQLWDASGAMWIVPSYQYTDSDGGTWVATAVNGKYLDIVQPAPMVMMGAAD